MAKGSDLERSAYRFTAWSLAFLIVAIPVAVALVLGHFTDFGRAVEPLFFEVMAAGVLPVLLVAGIVQYAVLMGRLMSIEISDEDMELVRYRHKSVTYLYGLVFLVGEGAALYAVATSAYSTFLVVMTCVYALLLLLLLLGEVESLADPPETFLPEAERSPEVMAMRKKIEEMRKKIANSRRRS